jgi:thioredoxin 1
MSDESVTYISDETYEAEFSAGTEPILLDFTAEWCEPCKAMDPAIEECQTKYAGKLRILKVDLDESPDLCDELGVLSIPTLIFVHNGEPRHRLAGPRSYNQLVQDIDEFLDR